MQDSVLNCSQMKQRNKKIWIIVLVLLAMIGTAYGSWVYAVQYFARVDAEQAAEYKRLHPKPATKEELFELVNKERVKAGIAPLTIDSRMEQTAQLKADDMAKYGYFEHNIPRYGNMLSPEMEKIAADTCVYISENLHYGTNEAVTARAAVDGWMGSKPHREAMLNPKYNTTGIGTSYSDKYGAIQVQHFCVSD